jgi:hypothetical protein
MDHKDVISAMVLNRRYTQLKSANEGLLKMVKVCGLIGNRGCGPIVDVVILKDAETVCRAGSLCLIMSFALIALLDTLPAITSVALRKRETLDFDSNLKKVMGKNKKLPAALATRLAALLDGQDVVRLYNFEEILKGLDADDVPAVVSTDADEPVCLTDEQMAAGVVTPEAPIHEGVS